MYHKRFEELARALDAGARRSELNEAVEACVPVLGRIELESKRYLYVGSGHSRHVWWDTLDKVIVKTGDLDSAYLKECNFAEYNTWVTCKEGDYGNWLAPTVPYSEVKRGPSSLVGLNGAVLLMAPVMPLDFVDAVILVPGIFKYYRANNFGWHQISETVERLVSVDYVDVEFGRGRPYTPRLHEKSHERFPFYRKHPVNLYVVGDCRNIETKVRCTPEGDKVPAIPKRYIANYIATNEKVVPGVEALITQYRVSEKALEKARAEYVPKEA